MKSEIIQLSNFFLSGLALFQQGFRESKSYNLMDIVKLPEMAEIKVTYDRTTNSSENLTVNSSQYADFIFRHYFDRKTIQYCEEFKVMYLDQKNSLLGIVQHSKGGASSTVVDIKQILGVALTANATSLILAHNHPTGNLKPSRQDLELTKDIKASCTVMHLALLDHLILTKDSYYSLADEGIL